MLGVYAPGIGWQSTGTTFGAGFHHVAVTVSGGTTLKVYYDGSQVYTSSSTSVNLAGSSLMSFGIRHENSEAWVGAVDQVRVYDRALTAAEIATLAAE